MILVDTSVWLNHFRRANRELEALLEADRVLLHRLIIGELACGSLADRGAVLAAMRRMPLAPEATHAEALELIERRRLMARGIGYIDVQLIAAALLGEGVRLWTADARLHAAAALLFIAYEPDR